MNEPPTPRRCLIVGATGGIGSRLARRLAARGTELVLAARDEDRLHALREEVGGEAIPTDATSFEAIRDLVEHAGDLDAAANLVGSIELKPAHLTSERDLRNAFELNLLSAFALVHAATGAMRDRGGSIVLMSSCAARIGLPNHELIGSVKAGVEGLTRSAAATYASSGIRVNAVAPGLVNTPLASRITSTETALRASEAMHPLGRIGHPDEVARVAEWLLEAEWVTGQVIGVDGGLSRVRSR